MAKRGNTNNLLGFLAFIAVIIKAVAFILSYFNIGVGIFSFVADIILTGVALLVAWSFAKTCSKTWRIVYYVILILVIVGLVFGGLKLV